jgi:hypothetical protein
MATKMKTAKAAVKAPSIPCAGSAILPAAPATCLSPVSRHRPCPEEIRLRAYGKWVSAGRPPGDGVCFWLAAEQELCKQA